ncbi:hypothetical protein [Paenibacillus sp. GP183]|uniref:hypothetical protein n=1 Tax=Paenibacillus sp. GP183 TaxID=1882751 RepID=UPI000B825F80|nr:hypothetical protein [Paenibacillus sp. GP183]
MGYFDADDQKEALLKHNVAVVTEIKKNTIIPEHCSPEGKPECEQGHALVFDGFDKDTYTAWFRGDDEQCAACPLQGLCEKQFGYSFKENPFFYGPVPQEHAARAHAEFPQAGGTSVCTRVESTDFRHEA